MITNIDINEVIVAEAMKVSGAKTKREVVDRALREMVSRANRPSIRELFGIGGVDSDYDPKAPWARGAEVGQFRVEQPRAVYSADLATAPKTPAKSNPRSADHSEVNVDEDYELRYWAKKFGCSPEQLKEAIASVKRQRPFGSDKKYE